MKKKIYIVLVTEIAGYIDECHPFFDEDKAIMKYLEKVNKAFETTFTYEQFEAAVKYMADNDDYDSQVIFKESEIDLSELPAPQGMMSVLDIKKSVGLEDAALERYASRTRELLERLPDFESGQKVVSTNRWPADGVMPVLTVKDSTDGLISLEELPGYMGTKLNVRLATQEEIDAAQLWREGAYNNYLVMPLSELPGGLISLRLLNVLRSAGITTLQAAFAASKETLLAIPKLGINMYNELQLLKEQFKEVTNG